MSERKEGWYWVRDNEATGGEWIPWEWIAESEVVCARWANCQDFEEVGSRVLTPEDLNGWKLVPVEPTKEMLREAAMSDGTEDEEDVAYGMGCAAWDWHLMLEAAPKPGGD